MEGEGLNKVRFSEVSEREWFFCNAGDLCRKVRPLNGCNTYNHSLGIWQNTDTGMLVELTIGPAHLQPRVAADEGRHSSEMVLYWHPCGHYELCKRSQLQNGEHYIPVSAIPELPRLVHQCKCLGKFLKE